MSVPGASPGPSQSGSRLVGDDVQHLVVWYWCLRAVVPRSGIASVEVEVDAVGNLDDVRVTFTDGAQTYWQVKAAVSAGHLANIEWLTQPNGSSLIKRLYESWDKIGRPRDGVALITGRPLDPNDALLSNLDRLDHLGPRLRRSVTPKVVQARSDLAAHVGCDEAELYDFLDVLAIHVGQTEGHWRGKVDDAALAAGLRVGEEARAIGLNVVREWVKTTRSPKTADELAGLVGQLGLTARRPRSVIVVSAVDVVDADPASRRLDWLPLLRGDTPETRRGAVDSDSWNGKMTADLDRLREDLLATDERSVAIRGAMRLPTWFAVGRALSDVAGFDIAVMDRGTLWEAGGSAPLPDIQLQHDEAGLGPSGHVALAVQISSDGFDDVRDTFAGTVERLIAVTLPGGPHRRLFASDAAAFAGAVAVRDWVRRSLRRKTIHLVLLSNGPFALFLGHLWDRVPPTTIYEDLAPGYESAFSFRNS